MSYILTFVCIVLCFDQEIYRIADIDTPEGYQRISVPDNSYQFYLRNFPLDAHNKILNLYNGKEASYQGGHYAILDIDVGTRDLQQCADAAIRLRAEYLYEAKMYNDISFKFTNGTEATFSQYAKGYRPKISGNKVTWIKSENEKQDYLTFRNYLNMVFSYAGSYSLSRDLERISSDELRIGDILVQGGFPGHAVIISDIAFNPKTGEKIILLSQSYMPAQEIHVIKNISDPGLSPWYEIKDLHNLSTPSWKFHGASIRRF